MQLSHNQFENILNTPPPRQSNSMPISSHSIFYHLQATINLFSGSINLPIWGNSTNMKSCNMWCFNTDFFTEHNVFKVLSWWISVLCLFVFLWLNNIPFYESSAFKKYFFVSNFVLFWMMFSSSCVKIFVRKHVFSYIGLLARREFAGSFGKSVVQSLRN